MKEKGFTMVELLVVILIIAIFPTIVISNFPKIKLQFTLSRVSYKFAQDIRRAQDMALSSAQYKDSFGMPKAIDGYGVYADITSLGNKKYIIYADAQPGNQQYDALDYLVETIDFSSTEPGVIIKEIGDVFNNKVSINLNSSNLDTKITQLKKNQNNVNVVFALKSDVTSTRNVSVNKSGLVEVK